MQLVVVLAMTVVAASPTVAADGSVEPSSSAQRAKSETENSGRAGTMYYKILDAATSGDGSQPAKTRTIAYRDLLTQIWIVDPFPGWTHSRNPLSRV